MTKNTVQESDTKTITKTDDNENDSNADDKSDDTTNDNTKLITNNTTEPEIINNSTKNDTQSPVIEVGVTNEPPKAPTKEELEDKKQKIISNFAKQVEELEKTEIKIDYEDYYIKSDKFEMYDNFLQRRINLPQGVPHGKYRADTFVNAFTIYNSYHSFENPQLKMMHTVPQRIIALKKLNEIFDYEFIDASQYFRTDVMKDISNTLRKFFKERNRYQTTLLEYRLITRFLQKLMILLCTYEELAFVGISNIQPNATFKYLVDEDFSTINVINPNSKLNRSWIQLVSALFDTTSKMKIFKFTSYSDLNTKFGLAFSKEADGAFLLEQLIGNTLKTCLWSVSLTYLYAIRSVYIFCRLFSIYVQEGRYKGHNKNEIIKDLFYIATVSTSTYEMVWHNISQCAKSFPSNQGRDLKRETKEYLNTHLFSSSVYYVLKMFEKSVPVLVNQLVQ